MEVYITITFEGDSLKEENKVIYTLQSEEWNIDKMAKSSKKVGEIFVVTSSVYNLSRKI